VQAGAALSSRLMRFFVAVTVVLLAAGCGRSPSEPTGGVRVSGHVLAFTTNTGVPGATVTFDPSEGVFNGATQVPSPVATATVTDASGFYSIVVPAVGRYWTWVDGAMTGRNYVAGSGYRGDLLVRAGTTCVARYGTITEAGKKRPVSGATVLIIPSNDAHATSGSDGWYRIDLGCPANGLYGFNTTFLSIKHPGYADFSTTLGRGVGGLMRLDVELQPR
jgi:hypothetical protein